MFRSLLLGKLAISIAVSLLIGGYGIWQLRQGNFERSEFFSWLGLAVFFLSLAMVQAVMIVFMFRKKKLD